MHPIEVLLGPHYFKTKKVLQESEYKSAEEHLRFQRRTLAQLLRFAGAEIPFYRDRMRDITEGITEKNVLEKLDSFPFTSKNLVRNNLNQFVRTHGLRALKVATGGSSASPMPLYWDRFVTRQREKAFMWNQWARVGYVPGASIVSFTGNVPKHGKTYTYNWLFNKYTFSSFNLIPTKIDEIIVELNRIKPLFLHGYPSTLTVFAKLVRTAKTPLAFQPRAALCGSEKTFPNQRNIIQDALRTKVYSWYGHGEMSALGGECECSQAYHLFPQYGYVEFIPADIQHDTGKQLYEMVVTGFNNWIMPFIRYKTGDYAIRKEGRCACGRQYPLIEEVVGRLQEFIVDCEGNLISVSALTSLFEKLSFIDELYIFQDRPGLFDLCVLPQREPSTQERNQLIEKIKTVTQGRLKPAIQLVKEIPKTGRGKRRIVDQRLDLNAYVHQ